MQVALLPIDEDRVRPPDLCQRFPVERDLSDSTRVELESWVRPGLPKVAVETVHLSLMMMMMTMTITMSRLQFTWRSSSIGPMDRMFMFTVTVTSRMSMTRSLMGKERINEEDREQGRERG